MPLEVQAVAADGALVLPDGRRLKLAMIEPLAETSAAQREWAGQLEGWLRGYRLSWKAAGEPDRWGRIPAHLFIQEPDGRQPPFWLQAGIVHHGVAALWPGRLSAPCWAQLLVEERRAIVSGRGLWSAERQADRARSLMAHAADSLGARQIMILRVQSVRSWQDGAFVNFVPSLHGAVSVFLTTRQVEALRNAQRDPFVWQGKQLVLRLVINEPTLRKLRLESIDQLLAIE